MSVSKPKPGHISREDWDSVASPPLSRAQLKKLSPAPAAMPDLVEGYRRLRGRPKAEHSKTLVSLRLDADVIAAFKADGPGWQSRINAVLARWAKRKKKAA
jgi:uncharacterized protein (DUF4415 family)